MIYTRFYTPVKVTAAEGRWIEDKRKGDSYPVWFVRAEVHPCVNEADWPGHGKPGEPVFGDRWEPSWGLKADRGLGEIDDACAALAGYRLYDTPADNPRAKAA